MPFLAPAFLGAKNIVLSFILDGMVSFQIFAKIWGELSR